ncbi:MAG: hypothetical protein RJQ08_12185 [Salinisphaeraceae bacterium]
MERVELLPTQSEKLGVIGVDVPEAWEADAVLPTQSKKLGVIKSLRLTTWVRMPSLPTQSAKLGVIERRSGSICIATGPTSPTQSQKLGVIEGCRQKPVYQVVLQGLASSQQIGYETGRSRWSKPWETPVTHESSAAVGLPTTGALADKRQFPRPFSC